MAGHSQFKNIMFRKGAQDAKRSRMFSKLAREITVAAKMGLPEPDKNPRLRAAIIAARVQNMPKDNIDRAIKKSQGGDAAGVLTFPKNPCALGAARDVDEHQMWGCRSPTAPHSRSTRVR